MREQDVGVVDLGVEEGAGSVEWFIFKDGREAPVFGVSFRGKIRLYELRNDYKI